MQSQQSKIIQEIMECSPEKEKVKFTQKIVEFVNSILLNDNRNHWEEFRKNYSKIIPWQDYFRALNISPGP